MFRGGYDKSVVHYPKAGNSDPGKANNLVPLLAEGKPVVAAIFWN